MSKYRLKKDIQCPDIFIPKGANVRKQREWYDIPDYNFFILNKKDFDEWIEEIKPERIEVSIGCLGQQETGKTRYVMDTAQYISPFEYPVIKQAIENALNEDENKIPKKSSELFSGNRMGNHTGYDAIYTEKDMEDCFKAARMMSGYHYRVDSPGGTNPLSGNAGTTTKPLYEDAKDYLQSLQKAP